METSFLRVKPIAGRCAAVVLLYILSFQAAAQDSLITYEHTDRPPSMQEILKWHEVFTYEVRYSFFKLGEVKTEIVKDTVYQKKKGWHLRTIIESNSGIPFVGEEVNHYNTIFENTTALPHTLVYWRDNVDEESYDDIRYIFDYPHKKVYGREEEMVTDTLELEEPASAGHLTFFLGRLFAGTDKSVRLPIYLNLEKGYITLQNTVKKEKREYDAFEEPVETYYSVGESTIEGPFGFKGTFKSWYLADDLRVPLEAHVQVWLGNVKIRLIDYKKERREKK